MIKKSISFIYIIESLILIILSIFFLHNSDISENLFDAVLTKDKKLDILYRMNSAVLRQKQILISAFSSVNFKKTEDALKKEETIFEKGMKSLEIFDGNVSKNTFIKIGNEYKKYAKSAYKTIEYIKKNKSRKALNYFQNELSENYDRITNKITDIAGGTMHFQDYYIAKAKRTFIVNISVLTGLIALFMIINIFLKKIIYLRKYE